MSVQGFHTIVIQVSDLAASVAFYEKVLGLEFAPQSDHAAQAKVGSSALLLHLEYEPLPSERGAGVHVNFAVEDAKAHQARLDELGLSPGEVSSKPWGSQFAVSDPDGYTLEFLGPP